MILYIFIPTVIKFRMNPRLIVNKGGNEKLENKIKKQIV